MEEPPACCPEPPRSRGTTDHGSEAIEIESLLDLFRDQLAVEPTPGAQKAPTLAFLPGTLASRRKSARSLSTDCNRPALGVAASSQRRPSDRADRRGPMTPSRRIRSPPAVAVNLGLRTPGPPASTLEWPASMVCGGGSLPDALGRRHADHCRSDSGVEIVQRGPGARAIRRSSVTSSTSRSSASAT
jgi:hypothetical protein